jgi:hypothetical protein
MMGVSVSSKKTITERMGVKHAKMKDVKETVVGQPE